VRDTRVNESLREICNETSNVVDIATLICHHNRLCGLVAEFLATDPEVPGLIPGATRFSEK
jgi:hypothetical protein